LTRPVSAPTPSRARAQALSRLTALEVLQLDKREEGEGYDGVALSVTPSAMAALATGWGCLHTLDLFNIGPSELPAEVWGPCAMPPALRVQNRPARQTRESFARRHWLSDATDARIADRGRRPASLRPPCACLARVAAARRSLSPRCRGSRPCAR
jgi:hypothetical protein